MKKLILQNSLTPLVLIYGGLALIMWPIMLKSLGIMTYTGSAGAVFLAAGLVVEVAGVGLRLYQQKQKDPSYLRNIIFKLVIATAIAAALMATGLIRTPAFLQQLF
jgi:hypothetical protein